MSGCRANTRTEAADRPAASAPASTHPRQPSDRGRSRNASVAGTTARSAVALPSHDVLHSAANALHGCSPPAHSVAAAIVAPMIVLASAPHSTTPSIVRTQLRDPRGPTYH